jgi:iron complex transport system substrate-binding protein
VLLSSTLAMPASTGATQVKDATGHTVTVNDTSRIVSIGGAVTEILYRLGLQDKIVAIDTTSLYPAAAAKEKKSVGYMRQLSPEGILGLAPSLILAVEGSGPRETVDVLQNARIPLVMVPDHFTSNGILEKIDVIARAVGAADRGKCVANEVSRDLASIRALESGITQRRRVLFVLSFAGDRAMAAGRNTAADGIIRLAGADNAIASYEGYKPISDEAIVAARPDVVLVMERGPGSLTADAVFSHSAFKATPAAATRSFISMDGLYLLGFGPRTAQAARDLAVAIYPDLKSKMPSLDKGTSPDDPCRAP